MPCPELAVTAGSSFWWGCSAGCGVPRRAGQGCSCPSRSLGMQVPSYSSCSSSASLPGIKLLSCCMAESPVEPAGREQAGQHLGSTGSIICACSCHQSCVLGRDVCVWGRAGLAISLSGFATLAAGEKTIINCKVAPWRQKHGETINRAFHNAFLWCHSLEFIKT